LNWRPPSAEGTNRSSATATETVDPLTEHAESDAIASSRIRRSPEREMKRSCMPLKNMAMAVELLVVGLIVVLLVVLACLARSARGRTTISGSVSEAQARENAAPLTTAILEPARRNGERRG